MVFKAQEIVKINLVLQTLDIKCLTFVSLKSNQLKLNCNDKHTKWHICVQLETATVLKKRYLMWTVRQRKMLVMFLKCYLKTIWVTFNRKTVFKFSLLNSKLINNWNIQRISCICFISSTWWTKLATLMNVLFIISKMGMC